METNKVIDIHGRDLRIKSAYGLLEKSGISEGDKKLILEFVKHKKISDHVGKLREAKIVGILRLLAELGDNQLSGMKPNKRNEMGIEDSRKKLEDLLDRAYNRDIEIRNQPKKKPGDATRKDYYIILKMFYSWMVGKKHPEEFDWIKIPNAPQKKIRVNELLLPEDIEKLCYAATNPRDILIPQLLFEVGGRIEEIASLRLEDIEPRDDGDFYIIHLNKSKRDKFGQEQTRSVLIDDCGPALSNYLNQHPLRQIKSAPLLVNLTRNNDHMNYNGINKVLKRLKETSGLDKCVRPHWFRKSATNYLRNKKKMNDASIKTRHGWKPASDMLNVYAGQDMEEANKDFLISKGKLNNPREEDKVQPRVCRYCDTRLPIGMNYCPNCKRPSNLTKEEKELKLRVEKKLEEMIREKLLKEHRDLISELETELKKGV